MRLVLLLLRRLPVVLLGPVGHANHLSGQRFAGRAADIVDDGDIVLAGETDPAQIAIAPVPSPIGRGADRGTGRLRN